MKKNVDILKNCTIYSQFSASTHFKAFSFKFVSFKNISIYIRIEK